MFPLIRSFPSNAPVRFRLVITWILGCFCSCFCFCIFFLFFPFNTLLMFCNAMLLHSKYSGGCKLWFIGLGSSYDSISNPSPRQQASKILFVSYYFKIIHFTSSSYMALCYMGQTSPHCTLGTLQPPCRKPIWLRRKQQTREWSTMQLLLSLSPCKYLSHVTA